MPEPVPDERTGSLSAPESDGTTLFFPGAGRFASGFGRLGRSGRGTSGRSAPGSGRRLSVGGFGPGSGFGGRGGRGGCGPGSGLGGRGGRGQSFQQWFDHQITGQ